MSYRDLKQNKQAQLEKIAAQLSAKSGFSETTDDRYWYPAVDKSGNGLAVIRFLPAPDGEDTPTIKLYRRSFQGPTGKWYINNCLSTIGKDDPINDYNNKLLNGVKWDEAPKKIKEGISLRKRKVQYTSNIYVVKDPANPENEGKVFLFNYGEQIRAKIDSKMSPAFEGEQRVNPFDLDEGANLKLKITLKDKKWRNYENSEWMTPGPLFKEDAKMEEVYNQEHKLAPLVAPDQFKSYEELMKQRDLVLGNTDRVVAQVEEIEASTKSSEKPAWEDDTDDDAAFFEALKDEELEA